MPHTIPGAQSNSLWQMTTQKVLKQSTPLPKSAAGQSSSVAQAALQTRALPCARHFSDGRSQSLLSRHGP